MGNSLPSGKYFSLNLSLRALTGGQTRAALMRNRMFAQAGGVEPIMLTLDSAPVYDEVRAALIEQGQLVPPMRLLNLYEFYRHHPPVRFPKVPSGGAGEGDVESSGEALEPQPLQTGPGVFPELDRVETLHPDGTLYRTTYLDKVYERDYVEDLHRPDGSVYLRRPIGPTATSNPMSPFQLVDEDGLIVASWRRANGVHRFWLRQLAEDAERVFVISDSRFALRTVVPITDRRFHVLHLMHNIHLVGTRRWNATLSPEYAPLLDSIADIDGLVTLTDRQRQDVAQRYGRTNNLFVVPNPVEFPTPPDPVPARDPMKIIVVSRLETQKQLDDAVQAFALVLEEVPQARLDIYGKGSHQARLEQLIADLDVGHAVRLCGHDPRARDLIWEAAAFLMSSRNEGYPLASLEAMARGCPVISYDIKYGPREQITDGVDGFLVEPGDIEQLAERVVRVLRDPDLAARLGEAALRKAKGHGYDTFLSDWRGVLEAAVANKPDRTQLEGVELAISECGYLSEESTLAALAGRLPRLGRVADDPGVRATAASFTKPPMMRVAGSLRVAGRGKPHTLDAAVLTLDAVCEETAGVVPLPLTATRSKRRFDFESTFSMADAFTGLGTGEHAVWLRLRLVWSNCSWETRITRDAAADGFEVSFTPAQGWLLHGREQATR
jgi:poly(glycerol-phosphate) alpha-glucosyltransferase